MPIPKEQGSKLSVEQLIKVAQQAGFSGDALVTAVAVAMAESGGNIKAHNTNSGTGDNSYSLWQINMLGGMGPSRRKQFGLKSNDDLFNPVTNAKAAYALSGGGKSFKPWTTYTKGVYKKYVPQVRAALGGAAGATIPGGDFSDGTGDMEGGGGEDRGSMDYQLSSFGDILSRMGTEDVDVG